MILKILEELSKKRMKRAKEKLPLEELKSLIYCNGEKRRFHNRKDFAFEDALKNKFSFICEVKKASPSKGVLTANFDYMKIAKEYEEAGADAISVLTEPEYFIGSNFHLEEISQLVNIPVLRKDFTVDEYQIYEAKVLGADAVLLICAILDTETLKRYIKICDELGLSALVEVHTEEEIHSAISAGARVIGVNNRNLKTFEVDINRCIHLRKFVPANIVYVAESGIKTSEDIARLIEFHVNAVLIGETLMRSSCKKEILTNLRGGSNA